MHLPFDIWLHITSFLPASQLRNLYGVNHALFEIAMDERYKEMRFDFRSEMELIRRLRFFKDSSNEWRVRNLHLLPPLVSKPQFEPAANKGPKSVLTRKHVRWLRVDVAQPITYILQVIRGMSNVKELTLNTEYPVGSPDLVHFLPVVSAGWTTFGATLRSLTLAVPLEGYCHVLTPSMVFPSLEAFTLRLFARYLTTDGTKIACDLLVPFVNNHHSTLQSFYLWSGDLCDVSPFLHGIRYLPQLRKLTVFLPSVSMRTTNAYGFQHILEVHSRTLRQLKMTFQLSVYHKLPTATELVNSGPLRVVLPHLEYLDIDLTYFVSLSGIILYLQRFNSLTHLVLRTRRFLYEEVEPVISVLGGRLKMLALKVRLLSPELLGLLAMKLPCLDRLHLLFDENSFSALATLRSPPWSSTTAEHLYYADWKLRHFTAYTIAYTTPTLKSADLALSSCKSTIAAALPQLQTLDVSWISSVTIITLENDGTDEYRLDSLALLCPIAIKGSSTSTTPWR